VTREVVLFGGPFDRMVIRPRKEPKRIEVSGVFYSRIDDPDTGESLSAYVAEIR
jgi:hypothetical protein